jgi:hypothetical protein
MPALSLPTLSITRGGGAPVAFNPGTATPSNLVGAANTARALSFPVLNLARGGFNLSPTISSLFEVVTSGANCPPIRRYPATGQRGSRAWTLG